MVIDWGGPKTIGKLAKTSSRTRLRYLDGSGEDVVVSLVLLSKVVFIYVSYCVNCTSGV